MQLRGTAFSLHFFGSVFQVITNDKITLSVSRPHYSSHLPTGYCRRLIQCFAELPVSQNRVPGNASISRCPGKKGFQGHSKFWMQCKPFSFGGYTMQLKDFEKFNRKTFSLIVKASQTYLNPFSPQVTLGSFNISYSWPVQSFDLPAVRLF